MADSMDLGSVLLSSASAEAVEKIGATVCTSWDEAVGEKSLVNNVPPSTWCIIETEGRLLHSRCDMRRMSRLRWDLTDDVSGLIISCRLGTHHKLLLAGTQS